MADVILSVDETLLPNLLPQCEVPKEGGSGRGRGAGGGMEPGRGGGGREDIGREKEGGGRDMQHKHYMDSEQSLFQDC